MAFAWAQWVRERRSPRIKELPEEEQPRERLLRNGGPSLSDAELLAILLRTGRPGVSALDLARQLLDGRGGPAGLLGACPRALRRAGLGPAKIAAVLAAVELGRRLARARLPDRRPLTDPAAVASYLSLRYLLRDQEVMGALFLDTRNRLIGESEIFRGTLNRAAVEPRPLLKQSLLHDAAGLILFHTHPSGDPAPSAEDLAFTRRMAEAGQVVGVRLMDHLVLGTGGRWVSLRQRGVC
ncbi:MAG: DNA repair protein RadC [Thermoanaerobaculia bacterium]|nr:DNA repair protein RadC [Thermoanaerobaculia bacterium]